MRIFENILTQSSSALLDFDGKLRFDVRQILDKQKPSDKSSTFENKKDRSRPPQKTKKTWVGRDTPRASQKKIKPKIIKNLTKSRAGRIFKPLSKR